MRNIYNCYIFELFSMLCLVNWFFHAARINLLDLQYFYFFINIFYWYIVCQLSLNLIKTFLICVTGKQWETLPFTIEVCLCMVLLLIEHYCAVAGIILIFRFLTIWSCTCRSCCQRFWPTVRPFFIWGMSCPWISIKSRNSERLLG